MSFFKNRRYFFQNVAHNNTLIQDGVDGRKSFFRINGGLELSAAALEGAAFPCVVQYDCTVLPSQPGPYVYRKTVYNELWFLSRFNAQMGVANQMENANDEAYAAAAQYISQLIKEWEINGPCGYFFHIDLNGFKLEMLGPVLDNTIGWRLTFSDLAKANEFNMDDEDYPVANEPEIIYFFDEEEVDFDWTESRRARFGDFPIIEVWYNNDDGSATIAWPTIETDAAPPDQTTYTVFNGSPKTGFIILK